MSIALPDVPPQSSPLAHGSSGAEWAAAHDALKANDALWSSLAFDGVQHDGRGGLIENRRCPHCGSTIGRPVSAAQALELCQQQAVVHALSSEAIAAASQVPAKRRRGFAAMSPEKHRAIASLGGKAAHQKGRAHKFNTEEARAAGRRGGQALSVDQQYMADLGRRGGKANKGKHRR